MLSFELLQALSKTRIPGEARQVLDYIIVETWGKGIEEQAFNLKTVAFYLGMARSSVSRGIKILLARRFIIGRKEGSKQHCFYRFNPEPLTWLGDKSKRGGPMEKEHLTLIAAVVLVFLTGMTGYHKLAHKFKPGVAFYIHSEVVGIIDESKPACAPSL